jgi:hypothetical protein
LKAVILKPVNSKAVTLKAVNLMSVNSKAVSLKAVNLKAGFSYSVHLKAVILRWVHCVKFGIAKILQVKNSTHKVHKGADNMQVNRRDELMAIALALERLALEIREAADGGPSDERPRRLQNGQRARITIKDRYRGRTGTIVNAHPRTNFWNIRLDPLDGGVPQVIYKKGTSLDVIDDK